MLCAFRRVKDHRNSLDYLPLSKETCVRQVVLDKWFPLSLFELHDDQEALVCLERMIYALECYDARGAGTSKSSCGMLPARPAALWKRAAERSAAVSPGVR